MFLLFNRLRRNRKAARTTLIVATLLFLAGSAAFSLGEARPLPAVAGVLAMVAGVFGQFLALAALMKRP
ncbi:MULTISPECIES: hypothetical protein [Gulbenkiania]|uniref:Uncharacterized protein n=2 Tax=Gulbenkiania TaxID=397456 RepID=A0A0K6H552_9NEIS|nr:MULTISPECIES: hypothetical protein [Gulbenkiania]TCW29882.1 hypothetical protein EV669_10856 [Gulbenkiania mobilis]CUA86098.1 hypothetical protein Ga0061063_2575 [Gulbenkiania indica]